MRTLALLLASGALAAPLAAQVSPMPGFEEPRLQTVEYHEGQPIRLVAFPDANLTVMLEPGERIERAALSARGTFDVSVVGNADSLNIRALQPGARAGLTVRTQARTYRFELETGDSLAAAYLVRFVPAEPVPDMPRQAEPLPLVGEYRISGDREIRPSRIGDDGAKTYIEWSAYQALPAVFGIGPGGDEEVVDGHMRGDVFTIDRVYRELVFRFDKEKAVARRSEEPGRS